ncbi:hypothetical protein W97_06482 [Coniosporium apollinis CBS 100218]|uniref:Tyrosine specific protein phosphatases domain-containing protein n=1 Tax=Coniosporium apollinis (strain CBS 100218) TaxID=1168221 RepID=R7YZL4_CONA1|nr:uncharacterized protein W97_06482 [Coniosporium apollinis CBS 100218]EON67229.1 hypothetical protein W97_06482 [Coniosporium apollinis CBS 100218]
MSHLDVTAREGSSNEPVLPQIGSSVTGTSPAGSTLIAAGKPIPSTLGLGTGGLFALADVIKATVICILLPCIWVLKRRWRQWIEEKSITRTTPFSDTVSMDAEATDPGLLKKHSIFKSYTVSSTGFTYPSLRIFFRPHPQRDKLPTSPSPIPLLVFIHGLGGSVAQFHPILTSLVNVADCLALDLPGCGLSAFEPKAWGAYTTDALVQLLGTVIQDYRDAGSGQDVVLIGHSMGCSLATLLASSTSPHTELLSKHVAGLIAICPKATPPSAEDTAKFRKLLWIPGVMFDLWRRWDRRGGTKSASVARFTGPDAEEETKKLQVRFNEQSRTPVWRRMASGILPDYSDGAPKGGMPGRDVWAGLKVPVFLIAGEADHVTPAEELKRIAEFLGKHVTGTTDDVDIDGDIVPDAAAPFDIGKIESHHARSNEHHDHLKSLEEETTALNGGPSPSTTQHPDTEGSATIASPPAERHLILKTTILPSPAAHALLYAPTTSRTISGLIQSFLAEHIDKRLSLGWQLQYLTTEGKWDVKNLAKWQAVAPVSEPIAGVFRAMKTLREVDEHHSPKVFVREWRGEIRAVIDISHDNPVYDHHGLEEGGIAYYKFPTVSKLPPTLDEIKSFIALVDGLRSEASPPSAQSAEDGTNESNVPSADGGRKSSGLIGVHCHYGFNRTGFFIVCYMVERLGYRLQDALDEFERRRPPGIRHGHFVDTLFVRYCVGLKRAPTL